jgi:hypothetical protein
MNDRDRIGGRFALAVRQSDLHLVSAKRGQRHFAAWIKDLARHQTRSEMGESSTACRPPVSRLLMGGAAGQAVPRGPQGGRGKSEALHSSVGGWVRSRSGSARAAARLESGSLPSPECECCEPATPACEAECKNQKEPKEGEKTPWRRGRRGP